MGTESKIDISILQEGSNLQTLKKEIIQNNINLYAQASKDFNPIHIDEEFARKTPLGGTIAHGMLVLAYVSQMMTSNFGEDWIRGGKLSAKFKAPARPGDIMTISGKVRKIEKDASMTTIKCDVLCANQSGEAVISADGTLTLTNRS